MSGKKKSCNVLEIERISYNDAFELQRKLVSARSNNEIEDTLILLEHNPVFTVPSTQTLNNILVPTEILSQQGIEVCRTDRGGDVTYHGPGQIVGYSIMDLKEQGRDLHRYIRNVEQLLIDTLEDYGIDAGRDPKHPGVWSGNKKVAAIGIAVKNGWITMHGFALNVSPDMNHFTMIVPCGITDKGVTSMAALLGEPVGRAALQEKLIVHYAKIFHRVTHLVTDAEKLFKKTGKCIWNSGTHKDENS
jgi:lipoyl(octanoyl) transferase